MTIKKIRPNDVSCRSTYDINYFMGGYDPRERFDPQLPNSAKYRFHHSKINYHFLLSR